MHMTHSPYCIDITTNQPGSHHDNVKPMHVFEPARPDGRKRVGLDSRQFWVAARVKKTSFGSSMRGTRDIWLIFSVQLADQMSRRYCVGPSIPNRGVNRKTWAKKGRFGDFLRFSTLSSVRRRM